MSKQLATQYFVYKLPSSLLRKRKWKLSLDIKDSKNASYIIQLASSQLLRFIDKLNNKEDSDLRAKRIRSKIKELQKEERPNKKLISNLYSALYDARFVHDYVCIEFDSTKDYDQCLKNGFILNKKHFMPFIGTTGGLKNATVIFISDELYDTLMEIVNCGRNQEVPFIPEKLSAYMALICSGSNEVSFPRGIIVVDECETTFTEPCINLDDSEQGEPIATYIEDREFHLDVSDGEGLMLPSLAKRWNAELGGDPEKPLPAGNMRGLPFTKGMVFCMDYLDFANRINNYYIKDAWGAIRDVRNAELILTTSMLKLWDSYSSMEEYLENVHKYGYSCALAKTAEFKCDEERYTNYQFLQSYKLTDEEIKELCQPTIDEFKDVLGLDYRKTLLFMKGTHLSEKNVLRSLDESTDLHDAYSTALMYDPDMINDPHLRRSVYNHLKKKIQNAKKGKIKVKGNFSIIAGDPYMLMESMFGLEPKGLLKAKEVYHQHWLDRDVDQIACFRAPMSSHYNIRLMDVNDSPEAQYWFRYLPSICILNGWDTCCEALNGADKDGDLFFTTNNEVLIKAYKPLPTICCIQRKAPKKVTTHKDILSSYKRAFGDKIGFVTNIVTAQTTLQWKYPQDSEEYKILDYRILCGQLYQQNCIDSLKGIEAKLTPVNWYRRQANFINEEDSEDTVNLKLLNKRITAEKKPYFMIYIYPHLMKEYKDYEKSVNHKCLMNFGISLQNLKDKSNELNKEELEFYNNYLKYLPVDISPCVVNRVCWLFEKEFDGLLKRYPNQPGFDHTKLITSKPYSRTLYYNVKKVCKEYDAWCKNRTIGYTNEFQNAQTNREFTDDVDLVSFYYESVLIPMCPDTETLTNILVDIYYSKGSNTMKTLLWKLCQKEIIRRLKSLNWGYVSYPVLDEYGDIDFRGETYSMTTIYPLPDPEYLLLHSLEVA